MAEQEKLTTGGAYAFQLLEKWMDIVALRENIRLASLNESSDALLLHQYVSRLTSLWGELNGIVQGRPDLGSTAEEFSKFREFYLRPDLLLSPGNEESIFTLELILRDVLEKLGVTRFG